MNNFDEKVIECLQNLSCVTSKTLSKVEKHENCGDNPAQTILASVTRPKNSAIIPNTATVQKLGVKIDQVEQGLDRTLSPKQLLYKVYLLIPC